MDTTAFSPSAEAISVFASRWHTCLAMGDGRTPAGKGALVVGVLEVVAPPAHPAASSVIEAMTASSRPRTGRGYQSRYERPVQDGHHPVTGRPVRQGAGGRDRSA